MHNLIKNKKFIFEFDYDSLFYYIPNLLNKLTKIYKIYKKLKYKQSYSKTILLIPIPSFLKFLTL